MAEKVTRDITTGVGTLSFPRIFPSTKGTNDRGEDTYDIQIIIPKTQRADLKEILLAIKEVGEAKWGDNWRKVRNPLRDGDKEADDLTEDGTTTKGEKYPERLGCYFLNARTTRPPGVYDRKRNVITNPDEIYGGCKGKIAVQFYAYAQQGNTGIGCSLNGVQKVSDGEPFGSARPTVESMFDMLDDEDFDADLDGADDGVNDEPEVKPRAAKKTTAKKTTAKKTATKKAAAPADDDLDDLVGDDDAGDDDDLYDDLDD